MVTMGQHRTNPVAIANAVPQKQVQVTPLGDGYCLAGLTLLPTQDEEGNFCVVVAALGGRQSDLVPMRPVPLFLGEVCKTSLEALKKRIGELLDGPAETTAAPEVPK